MLKDDDDERPTLVQCLACGGEHTYLREYPDGRYSMDVCGWCTDGSMTIDQVRKWKNRRRW